MGEEICCRGENGWQRVLMDSPAGEAPMAARASLTGRRTHPLEELRIFRYDCRQNITLLPK